MGRTTKEKIRKKPNTPGHDLEKIEWAIFSFDFVHSLRPFIQRVLRNYIKEIL